jgi:hypothetical protein
VAQTALVDPVDRVLARGHRRRPAVAAIARVDEWLVVTANVRNFRTSEEREVES